VAQIAIKQNDEQHCNEIVDGTHLAYPATMPRVDIWDVEAASKKLQDIDCGFPRDFDDYYQNDRVLGKGGFGLVRYVHSIRLNMPWRIRNMQLAQGSAPAFLAAMLDDTASCATSSLARLARPAQQHLAAPWQAQNTIWLAAEL
jgi:hypothetical protein